MISGLWLNSASIYKLMFAWLHSLVGNNLDYQSSFYIAEMLKVNCTIESLALAQNPFGDAGAVEIAGALKKNTTLLSLK